MAYINPNTDIRILKGIPWDSTYKNTLWFSNSGAQEGYFTSHTKYVLSNNTYQRVSDGVCRVNEPADGLYECNYMMFRNTSYGTKWFYAFITDVDYVNDGCSNIHFSIDSVQTWFFEAFGSDGKSNIKPCYVVRQHSETDIAGDNIEPEPVELGEYLHTPELEAQVGTASGGTRSLADLGIIVSVCDIEGSYTDAKMYNSIFSGATLHCYDLSETSAIESLINSYITKPDSILMIYMCPKFMYTANGDEISQSQAYGGTYQLNLSSIAFSDSDTFGGYTPKNKKLYTYPYYFGYIVSNNGQDIIFRYEFTKDGTPEAFVSGSYVYPPQYVVRPYNYSENDSGAVSSRTFGQSIIVSDFPQCSWNAESFKQWQGNAATKAQAVVSLVTGAISMIAGVAATAASAGTLAPVAIGAAATSVGEAVSLLKGSYTASNSADISKGEIEAGAADSMTGLNNVFAAKSMITAEYARDIDDYFTVYGYAQNKVMLPNPLARRYWTYIHTDNMILSADIPQSDKTVIQEMFNAGFTAWNYNGVSDDSKFGDYSLDNSV